MSITRGQAPPLPEKPPSVAERTRLLKSSFRKDDVEKPKVNIENKPSLSSLHSNDRGSLNSVSSNGEPAPSEVVPSSTSSTSSTSSVTGMTSSIPRITTALTEKNLVLTPTSGLQDSNKEVNSKTVSTCMNAAKREAFFKGGESPVTKFDPTGRHGQDRDKDIRDRERITTKDYNSIEKPSSTLSSMSSLNSRDNNPERDRDRKKGNSAKELDGYVGFANLPNQVYRKSVKRGFEFTLMVVGESGLGKSTLINSLFLSDLYSAEYPGPSHRIQKTVKVDTKQVLLKENGVTLRLTIVDTPGFGDAVDNSNCWQPVTDFIDSKYEEYLRSESQVSRTTFIDNRVHCCLYFIAPTGHGLKPLDVEFMKRLHDKVNIIPLIAKSDTMTPDECREFKKTVLNEIAQHKIKIYEFPDCEDEEESKIQKKLRDRVPFAVIGSNTVISVEGKKCRGRQYPWGIVEVENLEHNDFIALRNMLVRTHMQDLKDVSNNVHYENFRYNKLAPTTAENTKVKPGSLGKDPLSQMAEEKREHDAKMKKMEAEMEQVFEMKVKEKKQKLKDSEADLQRRSEQMQKSIEQQKKELDDKWKGFEKEKHSFEEQYGDRASLENLKDAKNKKKGLF